MPVVTNGDGLFSPPMICLLRKDGGDHYPTGQWLGSYRYGTIPPFLDGKNKRDDIEYLSSCITDDMYFLVEFWTKLKVVFQGINLFKKFGILTKFSKYQIKRSDWLCKANNKTDWLRTQEHRQTN